MTDGRFSGGSHGFIVGHVTPEAQEGGPIALVRTGDQITIDAEKNEITMHVSDSGPGSSREKLGRCLPIKQPAALWRNTFAM